MGRMLRVSAGNQGEAQVIPQKFRRSAASLRALTAIALFVLATPALADEPKKPADQPAASGLASDKPAIETQINDEVRVLDTVQAVDKPADGAEILGRIRAGVKVKAIGIVAGTSGKWVQIQLPNDNLAYVARASLAIDASGHPVTTIDKVSGAVSSVTNAATLVIGDRTVKLAGVDPGPSSVLAPFEGWVKDQGTLECEPVPGSGGFRCYTSKNIDVGEAAIFNGAAYVGDGATTTYRDREATARDQKKGLWGQP